jgi:hypothetical protein
MSLISKLFRKPPTPPAGASARPAPASTPVEPDATPAKQPTGPDPAIVSDQEEAALTAAVAAGDQEAIGRFVTTGAHTGIRQRAAQAVDDLVQLRELIRVVRGGNDKHVYRILSSKRDAILAQHREAEQLRTEIDAAAEALERHSRRSYDVMYVPTLEQIEKRWHALSGGAAPELSQRAGQALERSRELIRQHREALDAQAARERAATQAAEEAARQRDTERQAVAAAAAEQQRLREEAQRVQREQAQAEALLQRQLVALLRRAQAALGDGNTARAARLRGEFEEHRAAAPALPPWVARQVQQLDEKLHDLKDWKAFSVAPKREALMAEIESLAGATLEPVALAQRIREVRQQWRTLGKGAGENLTAEWQQRFNDAAERAYEPCRVYFAAQAEERRVNLERRATLVERLAAFSARQAENPHWRLVSEVLVEARREWRHYAPVDRRAGTPLQTRFDALWTALQASLDAEQARNVEAKRLLSERAAALCALPDTRQAIDEIRELQRRWKAVGPVPREQDGSLWETFRGHCDAVFARREQESAAYLAGLEANRDKAIALCEELTRIAALEGPQLLAGSRQLEALRGGFEALDLPRQGARELQQRFDRAVERCRDAIAAQQARAAQRVWTDLFEVVNRVRALALSAVRRAGDDERDALKQAAATAVAALGQWPKGTRAVVERQLAQAATGTVDGDIAANEAALRSLCVRAEILADQASPPEDQSLRQALQLQRLVQSMGQGMRSDASQLEALLHEWITVGPAEAAAYTLLKERFGRCILSLARQSGA